MRNDQLPEPLCTDRGFSNLAYSTQTERMFFFLILRTAIGNGICLSRVSLTEFDLSIDYRTRRNPLLFSVRDTISYLMDVITRHDVLLEKYSTVVYRERERDSNGMMMEKIQNSRSRAESAVAILMADKRRRRKITREEN